jgi:hypothetical protein
VGPGVVRRACVCVQQLWSVPCFVVCQVVRKADGDALTPRDLIPGSTVEFHSRVFKIVSADSITEGCVALPTINQSLCSELQLLDAVAEVGW